MLLKLFIFLKDGVNEKLLHSLPKVIIVDVNIICSSFTSNFYYSLLKDEDGNYLVSLKYPVYFPVMKECKVPQTRRELIIAFDKR